MLLKPMLSPKGLGIVHFGMKWCQLTPRGYHPNLGIFSHIGTREGGTATNPCLVSGISASRGACRKTGKTGEFGAISCMNGRVEMHIYASKDCINNGDCDETLGSSSCNGKSPGGNTDGKLEGKIGLQSALHGGDFETMSLPSP